MNILFGLADCSIYDVIVYGQKVLWVITKHMVKCRVESVIACTYFGCFTDRETPQLATRINSYEDTSV